jgi:hypothetical protein
MDAPMHCMNVCLQRETATVRLLPIGLMGAVICPLDRTLLSEREHEGGVPGVANGDLPPGPYTAV